MAREELLEGGHLDPLRVWFYFYPLNCIWKADMVNIICLLMNLLCLKTCCWQCHMHRSEFLNK
jgi:hypothetical protein